MAIKLVQGKQIATASWAINALTASFVTGSSVFGPFGGNSVVSASFAVSSSTVQSIANNITNNVNNNVLTATGGSTVNGETNLTFDGGLLNINGQLQQGESVLARGDYSHAEGVFTTAPGNYSHAEGKSTQAIGDYSHAEGERTKTGTETGYLTDSRVEIVDGLITLESDYGDVTANFTPGGYLYLYDGDLGNIIERNVYLIDTATCSPFVGSSTEIQLIDTTVNTPQAIVGDLTTLLNTGDFGGDQLIPGPDSHTEGILTSAIGLYSHTEGESTNAIGNASHAEGNETQAIGVASHAEGGRTQAIAYGSHAEGYNTQAIGDYSHTEGNETQATGEISHAEGLFTQAIGEASHAEGVSTQAIGSYSHAEGDSTIAQNYASHAEGLGTISTGDYSHVQGQYNISSSAQSAFIIGNGTANNTRSNLVFASGSTFQITGSLRVSGSITGSLFGTSSYAVTALSASYALTASSAPNYLPLSGGTITGSLTITNNLTVLGSASIQYISESTLNIGTNLITVNTINPGARFGGLAVIDSGSSPQVSASFLYDSIQDEFIFVHRGTSTSAITSSVFLLGPETYNNLGNETYLIANRIPKGTGIEHLNDSNISDNGLVVSINSNTQVTGSLNVTQGITGSLLGTAATASFAPNYLPIASPQVTGLEISFITDRMYGSYALPETGSAITSNTSSAIPGATNIIIHSASAAPTIGSDFKKLTGSSDYVAGLNYIYCTYIANNQIIYSINQAT